MGSVCYRHKNNPINMRKITYFIFLAAIVVSAVGFVKIQQLKDVDFEFFKIVNLVKNGPCGFDISQASIKSPGGRNAVRKSNILQISFAINEHMKDGGGFPNTNEMSGSLTGTGIFSEKEELNPIVTEYLEAPLNDPINNSEYYYSYIHRGKAYLLFARMEPQKSDGIGKQYYCIDSFNDKPIIISHNPSSAGRCEG